MQPVSSHKLDGEEKEKIVRECIDNFNDYLNRWPDPLRYAPDSGRLIEWTADGAFVRDINGREILDFLGGYGIFSLGHRHPTVINAIKTQLDRLALHSQRLLNPLAGEAAKRLAAITPGNLRKVFFCNSGTEAVEGALKLARLYTKKRKFISAINSFHGKTMGALSVTGRDLFRDPIAPLLPVEFVPYGDADAVEARIDSDTAAVILEPIQGEGGVVVPPDDYFRRVREICTRRGVLLVVDEVQTGLGRTGTMFCVDYYGVVPDILCLGKALSGGVIPCAAFTSTDEIWSAFHFRPLFHTSTFGSNPLACTAAIATIDVTLKEKLPERARTMGTYLLAELTKVMSECSYVIRQVRGRGLLIGLETVSEELAAKLASALLDRDVLVAYTLNRPEVIRIEPPLIVDKELIDLFLRRLNDSLNQLKS